MANAMATPTIMKRIRAAEQRVNEQHTRNAEKYEEEYRAFEADLKNAVEPMPMVLYKLKPGEVPSVMQMHMKRSRNVDDEEVNASYKQRLETRIALADGGLTSEERRERDRG